jgi:hypothetical protein
LTWGRDPRVHRSAHQTPPGSAAPASQDRSPAGSPSRPAAGRPDPSAVGCRLAGCPDGGHSRSEPCCSPD